MIRFLLMLWVGIMGSVVFAVPYYPIRAWSSVKGKVITGQLLRLENHFIIITQPEVVDMYGEPIEFEIPISRLGAPDQKYANELLKIQAEYELKLSHLKTEFPDEANMIRIKEMFWSEKHQRIWLYHPSDDFFRRYSRLCEKLTFDNFSYQMNLIRERLDSDFRSSDKDTLGRGKGSVAEMHETNQNWVRVYLNYHLGLLNTLAQDYQSAVDNVLPVVPAIEALAPTPN
ncbi:hypothetical protein [Cerasicoccus arenae]|uniref:hypothetical protein n=1 Tax=Cerasicoccus arenae TaxID=424488 RepID=UPI00366EF1D0